MLWGDASHNAMRRPYQAEHAKGSRVRIAARPVLEQFLRDWKYHNKLQPEQLNYAEKEFQVFGTRNVWSQRQIVVSIK
jgi:hypothetical protein